LGEFLELLGDRVALQNFEGHAGGLDTVNNGTGIESIYTKFPYETLGDVEIMYHVAPLLPYSTTGRQQIERKRHIGNDVTVIIFLEESNMVFYPNTITSRFNHVFIIVTVVRDPTDPTHRPHYRVNICAKGMSDVANVSATG
jgi:RAP1 GTPase activating protein 1